MAPFWVHNDIRLAGSMSYEVHNTNTQHLEDMTDFINDEVFPLLPIPSLNFFTGTWMLLVEWTGVHPFPHGDPVNFARNSTLDQVRMRVRG